MLVGAGSDVVSLGSGAMAAAAFSEGTPRAGRARGRRGICRICWPASTAPPAALCLQVNEAELASLSAAGQQPLVPLSQEAMKELSSEEIYKIYQVGVEGGGQMCVWRGHMPGPAT